MTDLISREAAIEALKQQYATFLSPEYATGQPLSPMQERFAVKCCIEALSSLPSAERDK